MAIKRIRKDEALRIIFEERRGERKIVIRNGEFFDLSDATKSEARVFAKSVVDLLAASK